MVRVLVTRPEPGASRTAQRLLDQGFQPILLPLTETVALPVDADGVANNAVAVAVTSANAVRHAPKEIIAALASLPCYAVGKRTAEAAHTAGFFSVGEGPGDAQALADALAGGYAGQTIVYLCGRVRFSGFEQRLQMAGVHVRTVETYDTVALDYCDEAVLARLSGLPVEAVLLYSANAAKAMQALSGRPALLGVFERTVFFALSARIAAALDDVAGGRIRIAPEPSEDALLGLLQARR
ncbi:MAG: uroporphyrinogen-III synthase [Mesorhizobium sp.]|uniref:uroporphyrinogen-III synthase n=1 Tax=unclassified Mesorhizobium TaxID=325217 RepID=UPI000FCAEF59|nr:MULTISPECIES: uroporphyrinogen-III synthase [unclassified Mesorhizobium]RUV66875.1 uroporphyrinogen-III synthase [Mesorhizobium sp. M5C.F.Cr.IN.023.01.1.1]RWF86405.1 MAG: uroporphyrinogen-III synthase [Mesorhizobium sp.]RWF90850.1 MAG: uroporphyrinogen-III synthase [Mesorhizobium sp.]RWI36180.1 MAG: uroporphyrinogen-III synthase [Mesorhizobium sp.]RWI43797.1 MAG: uroporphyrinogen-III synthase [Mesorhizobium sp.]